MSIYAATDLDAEFSADFSTNQGQRISADFSTNQGHLTFLADFSADPGHCVYCNYSVQYDAHNFRR